MASVVDRVSAGLVGDAARHHGRPLEPRHRPARRDLTRHAIDGVTSMTSTLATTPRTLRGSHRHGIHGLPVVWAMLGMAAGVYAAAELVWPQLNFGQPWLSFGRLRTAHTNLVLFGFGVSALIGTSFYSVQRTSHVRCSRLARLVRVLRVAAHDRARRMVAARRLERRQGVRGARVAVRHRDRRDLGCLRASCSSARSRAARSRRSTSRTGSTAR